MTLEFLDSPTITPERKAAVLAWVASFDGPMQLEREAWEATAHARTPEEAFEALACVASPRDREAIFESLALDGIEPFADSWFWRLSQLPKPDAIREIAQYDKRYARCYGESWAHRERILWDLGFRPNGALALPDPDPLPLHRRALTAAAETTNTLKRWGTRLLSRLRGGKNSE